MQFFIIQSENEAQRHVVVPTKGGIRSCRCRFGSHLLFFLIRFSNFFFKYTYFFSEKLFVLFQKFDGLVELQQLVFIPLCSSWFATLGISMIPTDTLQSSVVVRDVEQLFVLIFGERRTFRLTKKLLFVRGIPYFQGSEDELNIVVIP